MIEPKPWSSFKVALVASTLIAIFFIGPFMVGAVVGYLNFRSGPKTVEVIRHVTIVQSSSAPPLPSTSSTP